jgi:signal transduction histidine kinase
VASYLGHYAQEYFQETGIECKVDIPERLPPYPLSSQLRHHLLLAVHEAFTNALKHSHATQISVLVNYDGSALEIVVSDNGDGFDTSVINSTGGDFRTATGNGLRNMSRRLADIGGRCIIESQAGQGVKIRFVLPLHQPVEKW